jgi:drug/metabolite transporter (DMT)-like permease
LIDRTVKPPLEFARDRPIMDVVTKPNRTAVLSLALAGALWGLTVPLSKLSLEWLGGGWLTVARFSLAAVLLAFAGRRGLRAALTPRIVASGAVGFVSHAAIVVGAVPVLVALLAAGLGEGAARPSAWGGYALALAGIAMVAGGGGAGASARGDLIVLGSVVLSAAFVVVQPRLLTGRDPAAVTAVQFAAGALIALPVAVAFEGAPPVPHALEPVIAVSALAVAGTLLPFWLFAYGQARVPADLAGAFLNLEPLVGTVAGWLAFGEAAALGQFAGVVAVLAGIGLSTMPAREHDDEPCDDCPPRRLRPLLGAG